MSSSKAHFQISSISHQDRQKQLGGGKVVQQDIYPSFGMFGKKINTVFKK